MVFLPFRTDSPLRSTPYANWLLIALNVAAFAVLSVQTGWVGSVELSPRFPLLHQFITYQFVHASLLHLCGNMLFLFIFGNNVNDKMGNLGYVAFYLAGGVVAACAYVMTQHAPNPLVGASGSIAGVTGAYLILFPRSHVSVFYWFMFIGRIEVQALWFIALFFAQDVLLSRGVQDDVAHMAHIGGTIFGTIVCLSLLVPQLLPRDQFDVWALIQRWNKRRQYRDLVAKGYNPFDYTQATGRGRPSAVDGRVGELRDQITAALGRQDVAAAADLYLRLKGIDPTQVLNRQAQQDVATHLHHTERYAEAAEAYEALLRTYPKVDQSLRFELMLGLIYSRYLHQPDKARTHLKGVIERSHGGREMDIAREELAALDAAGAPVDGTAPMTGGAQATTTGLQGS